MSIELAWVILSSLGIFIAGWGFLDAWSDLRALGDDGNGRRIIARGYRRDEALRAAVHLILLGIGIGPLLNPDPVRFSGFVAALMTVNVLLVIKSVLGARDRLRVRRALHPAPRE